MIIYNKITRIHTHNTNKSSPSMQLKCWCLKKN